MTAYINSLTGAYPISESQIRADYPNTSFGVPFVAPEQYKVVFPAPTPAHDPMLQHPAEDVPVLTSKGHYEQTWNVVALPVETVAANKAAAQAAKTDAIKSHRDKLTVGGVKVGANWFHSDTFSRTQQLGLVMMGAGMPTGIQWKTMDATFVTMTPTLASQIFQATATSDSTLFAIAEAKRLEMIALEDPSGYDVSAGWPESR